MTQLLSSLEIAGGCLFISRQPTVHFHKLLFASGRRRKFSGIPSHRLLMKNHPRRSELVPQHGEPKRKERLLHLHKDRAAVTQQLVNPLHLFSADKFSAHELISAGVLFNNERRVWPCKQGFV
jgi:hypothetical protein